MGAFQNLVTIIALIGIVALLVVLLCRYLGGWTRTRTWVTSSREEKMVLTRAGVTGHYNPNGFMIPSDSDLNLSGGGSFRRFDKTDTDYQLLRQGSATSLSMARQPNIPPQPLRPAPLPPPSQTNQFQAQGSVDSVFTAPSSPCPPPKIPPPPSQTSTNKNPGGGGSGFPSLSSTNPFLPLIQASTQFFSQTLQSFQNFQPNQNPDPGPPSGYFQNVGTYYQPNEEISSMAYSAFPPTPPQQNKLSNTSTNSTSSTGGISMGELLFSTPPMYSPAPNTPKFNSVPEETSSMTTTNSSAFQIEPLLQLPVSERCSTTPTLASGASTFTGVVEPKVTEETDTLINMEPYPVKIQSESEERNSLLESMRAEIRLENKRMEDATKSLMEEELGIQKKYNPPPPPPADEEKKSKILAAKDEVFHPSVPQMSNGGRSGSDSSSVSYLDRPSMADRKFSAPEIGGVHGISQMTLNETPIPMIPSSSSHRTRSFSLRQASIDSIGDMSDLSSPDSLPSLQRAMSCDSVCSDTSVVLGDLDAPHSTGQLCIGLEYDSETADLIVNVIEGKELVGLDPDPSAPFDSYVRVYLLPDKTTNMQTRVYRKSLSPVYKEKFMFGLEMTELPMRSLVFYMYATNKFSNTLIGEAELKLNDVDIKQSKTIWLPLTDTGQRVGELGEIIFSLSYLPTAERLTVVVVKARNLKFPHQRDTGDPFVKVYLLQRGKKVSKKKSSTKRAEKNPIFNEAMIFSVPTHALQTIQLRISVSDSSETEGRAYSIGHVIVGSVASGKPLSHWNQMLSSLRKPIAMWHSLRK